MKNNNELYRLDNAAKIYPAAMTKNKNTVFRVSAYLKEKVKPVALRQAVTDLAGRFPTFYVQLESKLFWDYLKRVNNYDIVKEDDDMPCRPMNVGTNDKPMFRVLYRDKRISCEFFHSVTDGTGAFTYLKSLCARYLEILGEEIERNETVLSINDKPSDEETADAFQALYEKGLTASRKEEDSYQFKAEKVSGLHTTISDNIPLNELKVITKSKYKCTITEYLVGVYAYSFLQQYLIDNDKRNTKKPIKISVPVNLRPYFDSKTLRNFASFANVVIRPQTDNTLEKIIKTVKKQFAFMITKEKLHAAVSQNVSEEKMIISRISPIFLKYPVMKLCYKMYGEKKYTSGISNIGLIKLPESMEKHIDHFDFVLGCNGLNPISCGVAGFKNKLTVTFSSSCYDTSVQDFFFDTIAAEGIHITSSVEKADIRTA